MSWSLWLVVVRFMLPAMVSTSISDSLSGRRYRRIGMVVLPALLLPSTRLHPSITLACSRPSMISAREVAVCCTPCTRWKRLDGHLLPRRDPLGR